MGGGGGDCGCGFMGSGKDETVKRFLKCVWEREREKVCVWETKGMAKNEKVLKMKRDKKKNRGKI